MNSLAWQWLEPSHVPTGHFFKSGQNLTKVCFWLVRSFYTGSLRYNVPFRKHTNLSKRNISTLSTVRSISFGERSWIPNANPLSLPSTSHQGYVILDLTCNCDTILLQSFLNQSILVVITHHPNKIRDRQSTKPV